MKEVVRLIFGDNFCECTPILKVFFADRFSRRLYVFITEISNVPNYVATLATIIDFPNTGITYNGGWCSATIPR